MSERDSDGRGPIHFENVSGATINLGNTGDNVAIGANATAVSGPVDAELAAWLSRSVDDMAVNLAEIARENRLQKNQIELLSADLARVSKAVAPEAPDEQAFNSAALDLWSKLMMLGDAVHGAARLAESLKLIASTLGWRLAIPFL